MSNIIVLNKSDNIANAIENIEKNTMIEDRDQTISLRAKDAIPFGFKVAIKSIRKNEDVIKYGEVIGRACKDISDGELVHIHNVMGNRGRGDLSKS